MIIFFLKTLVIYGLIQLVVRGWTHFTNWKLPADRFMKEAPAVIRAVLFTGDRGTFQTRLMTSPVSGRAKLFGVALINLTFLLPACLFLTIAYFAAINGFLTGLQDWQNGNEIALTLSDPANLSLLICLVVGAVSGIILRSFGYSIVLVMGLIFPFFISIPGAVFMMFGDFALGGSRKKRSANIWRIRRFISLFALLIFWGLLGTFHEALVVAGFGVDQPMERLEQVALLIGSLLFLDTIIAMFILHFGWTLAKTRSFLTDSCL